MVAEQAAIAVVRNARLSNQPARLSTSLGFRLGPLTLRLIVTCCLRAKLRRRMQCTG